LRTLARVAPSHAAPVEGSFEELVILLIARRANGLQRVDNFRLPHDDVL
jgi:hypothetical protein